jgi:putative endonuclease
LVEHYLDTVGVTGSNPVSRIVFKPMHYTYVLRCNDGDLYVGSANDLRGRLVQHKAGRVPATVYRRPVILEYYEACRSEVSARRREKQLKPGYGRAYLKRRIGG